MRRKIDSAAAAEPRTRGRVAAVGVALAAASAITLGGFTPLSPMHDASPSVGAPRASRTQVQLTDLWTSLISQLANQTSLILTTATGGNPAYPLPTTSNAIAPVAEQVLLNVATYAGQLVSGQAGKIPAEVMSHLPKAGSVISTDGGALLTYAIDEPFVLLSTLITEAADYTQTHDPLNGSAARSGDSFCHAA